MRADPRSLTRAGWAAALAIGVTTTFGAAVAQGQAVDETCVLALTRVDDEDANVLLPDTAARYWIGAYTAVPGTRIRIEGRFPHARYMSFNIYDVAGRPLDSLSDTQIAPDSGSVNPFLAGADRTAVDRDYTVVIEPGAAPAGRPANTMYGGQNQSGQPNAGGTVIYRVYVPDAGTDDLGGTGLPTVTLEAGDPGQTISPASCRSASRPATGSGINALVKDLSPPPALDAARCPGADPPIWKRNVNVAYSYSDGLLDNECTAPAHAAAQQLPLGQVGRGGLYGNRDNDYLITPINRGLGQILVLRGKAPTFPDTRSGPSVMPWDTQLRYLSLCNYSPFTTRVVDCLADDELVVDRDGYYTVVVSTAAQRPVEARPECGVAWLAWGPETTGALLLRHMLPDPTFAEAIQRVPERGREQVVLGEYYPRGRYLPNPAAFNEEEYRCDQ